MMCLFDFKLSFTAIFFISILGNFFNVTVDTSHHKAKRTYSASLFCWMMFTNLLPFLILLLKTFITCE